MKLRALAIALLLATVPASAAPPNVVVILLDDASKLDMQIMGTSLSPNILARIVTPGVRFDNAFVTASLCTPSRVSLLTGQYPHNHGVLGNQLPKGGAAKFVDVDTLATRLQAAGYRTGLVGKYLNGYGEFPMAASYVPPGWDDWQGLIRATQSVYDWTLNSNGTITQHPEYQTQAMADIAAASVTAGLATGKPLFLYVAPMAPHMEDATIPPTQVDGFQYADQWRWYARPDPRDQTAKPGPWYFIANLLPFYSGQSPAFNEADISDKPAFLQNPLMDASDVGWDQVQYRTRLLCLLPVDDIVAKVAAALGPVEAANTIWVLTSDNGFLLGDHRRSQKLVAYEPSIRVPLYISGPGIVPHAEQRIALVQDLYPTILELAGASANPASDGRSLMPLLTSANGPWDRKRFLVTHEGNGIAPDIPSFSAVRTGPLDSLPQRTYVEWVTGDKEYYVLPSDTSQLVNRLDLLTELATMQGLMAPLTTCAGLTCLPAEN